MFPVQLCVTKLSGVGADCIFLGLIRPMQVGQTGATLAGVAHLEPAPADMNTVPAIRAHYLC